MNTMKHLTATLLAAAAISLTSHAQTVSYIVNEFNSASEVTNANSYSSNNGWGNWFGGAFQSVAFDSTSDSSNNPASGSLVCTAAFSLNDYGQYLLYDDFFTFSINALQYTNLQFDIRFAANSCLRTNGDGSTDFGFMQIGTWSPGFNQDYFSGFAVPSTTAGGQPNTNWVHMSIPLSVVSDSNLTNITDLIFHTINVYYGNTYAGTQKFWLDNIKFVGASAPVTNHPVLNIAKAVPGLRIFAGSTVNTYDREEIASTDQNQSWIGATYPVTYSFTLLDYNANIAQTHIFLLPVNTTGQNSVYGDEYIDYQASNELWMVINPITAGVTATVQWKTNLPNGNPNHTELTITNPTAVGTWTLTFNNPTSGTLTAPGASPQSFTINDPNVKNDFANPLITIFGLQPNQTSAYGAYLDYSQITVTNVAGNSVSENFATETGLSGSWDTSDSALASSVVQVPPTTAFWVNWTVPDVGFGLGTAENVQGNTNTPNAWMLPEYYGGYSGTGNGTVLPGQAQQAYKTWAPIPIGCLPTVDGSQNGTPAATGFFQLSNPGPTE